MSRARKKNPGRILFVGAGPGNPGLLTADARAALVAAPVTYADGDVSAAVLELAGAEYPLPPEPAIGFRPPAPAEEHEEGPRAVVHTAVGEPADVARQLVADAKTGVDVVRLVTGDPLTRDSVLAEIATVARTQVAFTVEPGVSAAPATAGFAGMAPGSTYTVVDARGDVDWAAVAGSPAPLLVTASVEHLGEIASSLVEHGLAAQTPAAATFAGTTVRQRTVEATLATLAERAAGQAAELIEEGAGQVVVTVGRVVGGRGRQAWWESRELYGWKVLVPRTREQSASMTERLRRHGAVPAEVPTISVEPPRSPAQMERAVKGLVDGRYLWLVLTSTNAVRAVRERFEEFGLDARAFSGVKIACVGEATARAVREFGINPELVPSGEQSSRGLLEEFPPYDDVLDPVNRVLMPRADIATETLSEGLRERGWEIEDVTAYRTVRAAPPPAKTRDAIKSGGFDAVCFTSSSTVRNLVGIAGKPHARTVIACIGPKTAETAAELGLRVDVQPEKADVLCLVDALAEHVAHLREVGELPPPRRKPRRRRS